MADLLQNTSVWRVEFPQKLAVAIKRRIYRLCPPSLHIKQLISLFGGSASKQRNVRKNENCAKLTYYN